MTMMALLFLVTAPSASAATRVWSGGGGNGFWNNGANWVGGVVPVSGDALAFPTGTLNVTNTNNIVALRLGLTTFGGSNFTIHGSASVTNDAGILCTNASGVNTWNLFTTLGSNQTYNVVNSRAALNVSQTLSLNGKTLTLAGSGTNLLSGIVADFVGGGGMIVTGGGWTVMTRTNSLPDTITVSQGNLIVNGSQSSSPVVVNGGVGVLSGTGIVGPVTANSGFVAPGDAATLEGALTIQGNLRMGSGSTLRMIIHGTNVGEFSQLVVNGIVALTNNVSLSVTFPPPTGASFTIISNDLADAVQGIFAGLPEGATFLADGTRFRVSYIGGSGNDVVLTVVSSNRVWNGAGTTGNWGTAANWVGGIAPTNGDDIVFPLGAARPINTNDLGLLTIRSLTFGGSNYVIRGTTNLILGWGITATNGVGPNTFETGVLFQNRPQTFSNNNTLSTLIWGGSNNLNGITLTLAGNGTFLVPGLITDPSGIGSLFSDGPGVVVLSGNNTYSGETLLNGGTLRVNGTQAASPVILAGGTIGGIGTLGKLASSGGGAKVVSPGNSPGILNCGNVIWDAGTTLALELNGTAPGANYDQVNVSGSVDLNGASLSVSLGFNSLAGDSFTIIKNDGIDPVLNTFASLAEGGILILPSGAQLQITYHGGDSNDVVLTTLPYAASGNTRTWSGAGTNGFWSNGSNWVGNIAPVQGDDLLFPPAGVRRVNTNDFASGFNLNSISFSDGSYTCRGNLALLSAGVTNRVPSTAASIIVALPLKLVQHQSFVSTSASTLLNFTTNIDSNGRVLTLDSAGIIGVSGAITGGGSILKLGGGVASLSASNSYLGNTTISAGNLTIANGFALGAGSGSTLVGQNATLEVTGSITVAESMTLRGVLLSPSGNNTVSGTITLGLAASRVNVDASSQLSLSGILTGPGGLNKEGLGTLVLSGSGTNDYVALTTVRSGVLVLGKSAGVTAIPGDLTIGDGVGGFGADVVRLAADNQIADSAGVVVNGSGMLDLTNHFDTIGDLEMTAAIVRSGTGQLTLIGDVFAHLGIDETSVSANLFLSGVGDRNFNIDAGALVAVYGRIDGSVGLTMNGPGKLVLENNNFYIGPTRINGGFVEVNGSQTSSPLVLNGGTLTGIGTVGALTSLPAGGTVSPGDSPGILGAGNTTFNSSTHLIIELSSLAPDNGFDQLNVTGTVDLGSATLDLIVGFTPAFGTAFTIVNNDGSDPITGTFVGLPEGSTITAPNGSQFQISYHGGTQSNDVVLTTVFQPGTGVTRIWDGGGTNNNWMNASNWVGDVAPNPADDLVFPQGAARLQAVNNFPANTTFNSITIGGTNYVLTGNAIVLNAGLTTTNAPGAFGLGANVFAVPIVLAKEQTFSVERTNAQLTLVGIDLKGKNLTFDGAGQILVNDTIAGAAGITKTGSGLLAFVHTNSYSGLTEIRSGTLELGAAGSLGSLDSGTTVFEGATLTLSGTHSEPFAEPLALAGTLSFPSGTNRWTGPIELQGTNANAVGGTGSSGVVLIIDGLVSGNAGFHAHGHGRVILNANNTYAGATKLSVTDSGAALSVNGFQPQSPIIIGPPGAGFFGGNGVVGPITGQGAILSPGASPGILTSSDLNLDQFSSFAVEINGPVVGPGYDQLRVNGTVTINFAHLDATFGYTPAVGDSFLIIDNDGTDPVNGQFFWNDTVSGDFFVLTEGQTFTNGPNIMQITYRGGDGNDVVLTKIRPHLKFTAVWTGAGTDSNWMTAQNWRGNIVPNPGNDLLFPTGVVQQIAINNFPAGTGFESITFGGVGYVLLGTNVVLNGGINTSNFIGFAENAVDLAIRLGGNQTFRNDDFTAAMRFLRKIDLNNHTLAFACDGFGNAAIHVDNEISGNGALIKTGGGILFLSRSNSYSGPTLLQAGLTEPENNAAFGSAGSGTTVSNAAEIVLGNGLTIPEPLTLAGAILDHGGTNVWTGSILLTGSNATLSISSNSQLTMNGLVNGSGLAKTSGGVLILNADNLYSGPTTLVGGTCVVNGFQLNSPVTVDGGAVLNGSGTVGILTVLAGTVSPGFSVPATLQVLGGLSEGGLSFSSNAVYRVDFVGGLPSGPEFDQLRVHGTIEIDNSTLQLALGFTPDFGRSFIIIDNIGAAVVTGTFANLPEGGVITTGGVAFQITYVGGTGNDVVLTRVHPPSTISSIVCDTNGFKQIQGSGDAGFTYTIQAATNLNPVIQWTTLGTANADGTGLYQFIDMDAPIYAQRFYRVISP